MAGSASYRYSINGQEKEPELNENVTTAEFWTYDSRVGRRWNLDPVYKSSVSNYLVFGNNPVLMVDPLGNDWYSKNGKVRFFEGSGEHKGWKNITGKWTKRDEKGFSYYYGHGNDDILQSGPNDLMKEVVINSSRLSKGPGLGEFSNDTKKINEALKDLSVTAGDLRNMTTGKKEIPNLPSGSPLGNAMKTAKKAFETIGDIKALTDMSVNGNKSDFPAALLLSSIGTAIGAAEGGAAAGVAADILIKDNHDYQMNGETAFMEAAGHLPPDRVLSAIGAYNKVCGCPDNSLVVGYVTRDNLIRMVDDKAVTRDFLKMVTFGSPYNLKDKIIYSQMIYLPKSLLDYPVISMKNIGYSPTGKLSEIRFYQGFQFK